MLRVVFLAAGATLGLAAWWSQRGYRTCLCHSPRRRFRTVAERKAHERNSWGSFT